MAQSKFRSADFIVDSTDLGTIGTVSAGAVRGFTLNLKAINGYEAVGVLELQKGGASSGHCLMTSYYIANNTLYMDVKNTATVTATVVLLVTALYQKI